MRLNSLLSVVECIFALTVGTSPTNSGAYRPLANRHFRSLTAYRRCRIASVATQNLSDLFLVITDFGRYAVVFPDMLCVTFLWEAVKGFSNTSIGALEPVLIACSSRCTKISGLYTATLSLTWLTWDL
jgi:hypothetical protein